MRRQSLGKLIKRDWSLQGEILLFSVMKNISHDFITNVKCKEWISKRMFAAAIFEKLIKTLQEKGIMACVMWNQVKTFRTNLKLFPTKWF